MEKQKSFNDLPERNETLAGRKEEKLRSLSLANFHRLLPAGWVKQGEILGLLLIFFLNLYLLGPFFGGQDQLNVFSAPLIPALARITSLLIPYNHAIRLWLIIFSLALPFSLYFFAKEVSGRKLAGFISALMVSLPLSIFLSLRISLGLLSGDGPYIASLALIPLVSLLLLKFLRHGNFWMAIASGVGAVIVALMSPLGLLILLCFSGVITFSEVLLGSGRLKLVRFGVVLFLTAGFSAFWYNPKFIILTLDSSSGQMIKSTFANLLPPSLFLVPLLLIFGFLIFENRAHLQPMFLAIFLTIVFGLISIGSGMSLISGSRFLPTLGVSFALLTGFGSIWLFDFLRFAGIIKKMLKGFSDWQEAGAIGFIAMLFGVFAGLSLLYGTDLWQLQESDVLGWSTDKSIGIWEIREQTSTAEGMIGYSITALTVLGVGLIKKKLVTG